MKSKTLRRVGTILIILLSFILSNKSWSQNRQQDAFWDHVRFGGGIGLSFGNGFFSGTLAPSAIYQVNRQFAVGIGLTGTYNSQKDRYNSTILGGSILALYNIIPEIQFSAEFEELNVTRRYENFGQLGQSYEENYWYPALFMGVGFHSGNVTVGIRYDVLYKNTKSIYADAFVPFVRVYF
ncbi:MAG TPA: hypothetical protein VKX40_02075 [Aequorivita sp.]|nr:hypothetical protein [Aequorivita sp.]